jgi:hypothetical protein
VDRLRCVFARLRSSARPVRQCICPRRWRHPRAMYERRYAHRPNRLRRNREDQPFCGCQCCQFRLSGVANGGGTAAKSYALRSFGSIDDYGFRDDISIKKSTQPKLFL